jgi:beta-lactam-binding protein with PASTA domain
MLRKILTYLAIFGAAIVGVALLLNFAMAIIVGGRHVDVPDVRGLSQGDAVDTLHKSGLKWGLLANEYSLDYPESTVVMQDPPAGRTVKQGRKVFLSLSQGPEFCEVPFCQGKSLRAAELFIERAGLSVGTVAETTSPGTHRDEVLATDPPMGGGAMRGGAVNILVSKGPPATRYLLPDLTGRSYIVARIQIERLGMFVRESGNQSDFMTPGARIVAQDPPAGFIVARGDTITLSASARFERGVQL